MTPQFERTSVKVTADFTAEAQTCSIASNRNESHYVRAAPKMRFVGQPERRGCRGPKQKTEAQTSFSFRVKKSEISIIFWPLSSFADRSAFPIHGINAGAIQEARLRGAGVRDEREEERVDIGDLRGREAKMMLNGARGTEDGSMRLTDQSEEQKTKLNPCLRSVSH